MKNSSGSPVGGAYVIFGKTNTSTVDLANLGSGGFAIVGATPGAETGVSISTAGDFNGDGLSDIIIGAPNRNAGLPGMNGTASAAYVVFGKTDSNPVDLANLGSGGLVIQGSAQSRLGITVSGAGDFNGDGYADVIVSDPTATVLGRAGGSRLRDLWRENQRHSQCVEPWFSSESASRSRRRRPDRFLGGSRRRRQR